MSLPGSPGYANLPVWGFSDTAAGAVGLVGPTVVVARGDHVIFHLHNTIAGTAVSLAITDVEGLRPVSDHTGVATGATAKDYTFDATRPGTYLYQAGATRDQRIQLAMGLVGALIVRPDDTTRAYADSSTTFTDEAVEVMSDLDPAVNVATNPTAFDMRRFTPTYRLLNGKAYPDTETVPASSGGPLLLRMLNAGSQDHALALFGLHQRIIADDSNPLAPAQQYAVTAETVGAGQTLDTIVDVPASTPSGRQYLLADGGGELFNPQGATAGASVAFGGMLTSVVIAGVAPPPMCHPQVASVSASPTAYAPSASTTLTATLAACPPTPLGSAEYSDGAAGPWTPMALSGTSASVTVSGLSNGPHTLYVRASDANGPGDPGTAAVYVDGVGPTTSGLSVTPDPHHTGTSVTVRATGDDRLTGGANATAAEAFDGGVVTGSTPTLPGTIPATTALALTSGGGTAVAGFTGTLAVGSASGRHAVWVRSRDALTNWGDWAFVLMTEDNTGPALTTGSTPTVTPNPTNGLIGYNASSANVKVSVSFTDALTAITGMRGWIDTVSGSGTVFSPADGAWNSPTEVGQLLVPLTTIRGLSNGAHTMRVQATDAAGNVSATASIPFTVDKTAPVLNSAVQATTTAGGVIHRITVQGTDDVAVTGAEWFRGTDPGVGKGTQVTVSPTGPSITQTFTVPTASTTANPYRVRIRDAAGNWSALRSVVVP